MQIVHIAVAAAALPSLASAACLAKKQQQQQQQARGRCATVPTEESLQSIASIKAAEAEAATKEIGDSAAPLVIPTYLHAVVNSSASADVLDAAALEGQLATMNARFAPHGIQFALAAGGSRRVDDALAAGPYGGAPAEPLRAYWKDTRRGGYDTLNLWFYSNFPWDIFGACTLPEAGYPEDRYWDDGCHIASGTLPGGDIADYNLGLTAVHEVGHWLGLLHTFESYSCSGDGDLVDDTPQEADPTSGCPKSKDSCPSSEGTDPVSNYMDYSSDPCFEEFTPGQEERMHNSYTTLREGRTA